MRGGKSKAFAVFAAVLSVAALTAESADARRRGGGFGSRGVRTYQAPPPTRTALQQAAPMQRSMTPPSQGQQAARPNPSPQAQGAPATQRRGGFMGGMAGGLLGGLVMGGLIGAMMGNGFGAGMAGFATALLQIALIGGLVFLALKLFRRRQQPAMAGAPNVAAFREAPQQPFGGSGPRPTAVPITPVAAAPVTEDIGVTGADRETFERLLMEIQDALGREDYAALRERTTPEIMGFLAEDMAQYATAGRRNEISGTKLLEADLAEAWREDDTEYATAAMRYSAIDVVRDRASGAVVEGDPDTPYETTELWTFVRPRGGAWKLSAIQTA